MTETEKVEAALELLYRFGQQDGESHHQTWLLDQLARILAGSDYEDWVTQYREMGDYDWNEGVAP